MLCPQPAAAARVCLRAQVRAVHWWHNGARAERRGGAVVRKRTGRAAAEDDADEVMERAGGLDVGLLVVQRVEEGHEGVPGDEAVHADAPQQRLQDLFVLVAERRELLRAIHEHRELGLQAAQQGSAEGTRVTLASKGTSSSVCEATCARARALMSDDLRIMQRCRARIREALEDSVPRACSCRRWR